MPFTFALFNNSEVVYLDNVCDDILDIGKKPETSKMNNLKKHSIIAGLKSLSIKFKVDIYIANMKND